LSDYNYIMGSLFGIALFLLILGNLGAADDIYGDDFVVVDTGKEEDYPTDYDFDIDRIRFTPEVDALDAIRSQGLSQQRVINSSNITLDDQNRLRWDGNGTEGFVIYDVADRDDTIYIEWFDAGGFFYTNTVGIFVEDVDENRLELTGDNSIDLSGEAYPNLQNIEELEIRLTDVDSWADISGFTDYNPNRNALELIADYLRYALASLVELPAMVAGYVAFVSALPGFLGTVLRIFIGIFLLVFIVKEFWLG